MNSSSLNAFAWPTFAELYCARRGITSGDYRDELLREVLYPRARWLRMFLGPESHYFSADYEFVEGVAVLRSRTGLEDEVKSFLMHPENGRFERRRLKLRISATRMKAVVNEVMPLAADLV